MSEELSRVEDLLENGVEQPVLPMSELEAILRGEKVKPHSRVAELLLQYNPSDILIEKSITENGTYYASADNAAGYFKVVVDTPVIPPVVLDHLVETITENGTYNYTSEHDGYSDAEITVNVPSVQPVVAPKTITANGTYVAADEQLDGYSQVTIDVAGGGGEPSEFYRYIPAVHGTIVLRQRYTKVLGQYEVENKVFFNGYHLTEYDTIPAEIYNYIPDIDVSGANWTDSTSTTQDGWISIVKHTYNQLRCYTQSWGSFLSNIDIWAVVDLTGGNAQTLPWSDPYDVEPAPIESENVIVKNVKCCDSNGPITIAFDRPLTLMEGYLVSIKDANYTDSSINFFQYYRDDSKWFFLNKNATDSVQFSYTDQTISGRFSNYHDRWISIYKVPSYFYCIPEQS